MSEVCIGDNYFLENDLIKYLNEIAKANDNDFNFNYYTEDDFNSKCRKSRNLEFSAFHINVRSLNSNNRSLAILLGCLNVKFDILVLSEILEYKLEFYGNLFKGYKFYYEPPKNSRIGGIGIFVKHDIICNERTDLVLKMEGVENLRFELTMPVTNNHYIIGAIYSHPNNNMSKSS